MHGFWIIDSTTEITEVSSRPRSGADNQSQRQSIRESRPVSKNVALNSNSSNTKNPKSIKTGGNEQSTTVATTATAEARTSTPNSVTTVPGTKRRVPKQTDTEESDNLMCRLREVCTSADPTGLYQDMVKIGQG